MRIGAGGGFEPWACASPLHLPPTAAVLPLNYCRHSVADGFDNILVAEMEFESMTSRL